MNVPERLVLITATGTEVGKTWVGASLARLAVSRGWTVSARKPAQSWEPAPDLDPEQPPRPAEPTDADCLGAATGESADVVCPASRSYPVALAPPMAAEALGQPVPTIAQLAEQVTASWTAPPARLGLVEGAGGVASPLAADGDTRDLARALGFDAAVLVALPRLGVINDVRLCAAALAPIPVIVHLNRYSAEDPLHVRNAEWLRDRDGFTVTTDPSKLLARLGVRD